MSFDVACVGVVDGNVGVDINLVGVVGGNVGVDRNRVGVDDVVAVTGVVVDDLNDEHQFLQSIKSLKKKIEFSKKIIGSVTKALT